MMDLYFSVDAFDYGPAERRLRALEAWKANVRLRPQGSPLQYANFGYLIAGAMIEATAGLQWARPMHERMYGTLALATAGLGAPAPAGLPDPAVATWPEGAGWADPQTGWPA